MENLIKEPNKFGVLEPEEVTVFEAKFGKIPEYLTKFLFTSNGGSLTKNILIANNKIYYVAKIFGIQNVNYSVSMQWHLNMLANRIPRATLPIADDSAGNLYLISIAKDDTYDKIYFWDHNIDDRLNKSVKKLECVSENFAEFISSLIEDKLDNDTPPNIIETDDEFIID